MLMAGCGLHIPREQCSCCEGSHGGMFPQEMASHSSKESSALESQLFWKAQLFRGGVRCELFARYQEPCGHHGSQRCRQVHSGWFGRGPGCHPGCHIVVICCPLRCCHAVAMVALLVLHFLVPVLLGWWLLLLLRPMVVVLNQSMNCKRPNKQQEREIQ